MKVLECKRTGSLKFSVTLCPQWFQTPRVRPSLVWVLPRYLLHHDRHSGSPVLPSQPVLLDILQWLEVGAWGEGRSTLTVRPPYLRSWSVVRKQKEINLYTS